MLVPDNFLPLLIVFRHGLPLGLVTKDQITQWADKIIIAEDEPDYFFIQLSLSRSIDELIATIDDVFRPELNQLYARVLLGLLYYKLDRLLIDADKAVGIMYNINTAAALTDYERYSIYELDSDFDRYRESSKQLGLADAIVNFLSIYSAYTLDNWEQWPDIHIELQAPELEHPKPWPEIKVIAYDLSRYDAGEKKRFTLADLQPWFWILSGVLLIWCLYALIYRNGSQKDISGFSPGLWLIIVGYYIGQIAYRSFRNPAKR